MLNKTANLLVIGLGRIGTRHYNNLKALGFKNIFVYDVDASRVKKLKAPYVDSPSTKTLSEFTAAFICNPTHEHVTTALACAKAGCHVFIEKPLSHNLRGISELKTTCKKNKVLAMVGCNMRFHPCIAFIKKYITSRKLGIIYSIHHEFGEYLPNWRSVADYKKSYAEGGGIILDDIHEFDMLFWLAGGLGIKKSNIISNCSGAFAMKAEDSCIAAFEFKNGILGSVRCDYLQRKYARTCKIVGERGTLSWDFNENTVWLHQRTKGKKIFFIDTYDNNKMYADELNYFLKCISQGKVPMNSINEAIRTLESITKGKKIT